MNRLDLIVDALENSEPNGTGWVHVHEQKHQAALAAARELRELKPVAVRNKAASAYMEFSSIESWESGIPSSATLLYALDEVNDE
jgi:hypothetical protein